MNGPEDSPEDARPGQWTTATMERPPLLAHLEDPARERRSLCGIRLKRDPAPSGDPCAVCLSMKTYGRFAGR